MGTHCQRCKEAFDNPHPLRKYCPNCRRKNPDAKPRKSSGAVLQGSPRSKKIYPVVVPVVEKAVVRKRTLSIAFWVANALEDATAPICPACSGSGWRLTPDATEDCPYCGGTGKEGNP